jgi:transcriptional regulator with XRE-family HTH domain
MAKHAVIDPNTITGQLRQAILDSGKTQLAIGEAAGVDAGVISRFMSSGRDLRLRTVDKIAAALGLRLCQGQDVPK